MRRALIALAFVLSAATATADVIVLETAPPPDTDQAWVISSNQSLAARFHLDARTVITKAGGPVVGDGSMFVAIVAVSDPSAVPTGNPLSPSEVRWYALVTPAAGGDVLAPVEQVFEPGDYLLVFGSGLYGATGSGVLRTASGGGSGSYAFWHSTYGRWYPYPLSGARFLVYGDAVHSELVNDIGTRASQVSVDAIATSVSGIVAGVNAANATLAGVARQATSDAILTNVNGLYAAVGGLPSESNLNQLSTTLEAAIGTRATQSSVDALAAKVDALQQSAEDLRPAIERALASGQRILSFMLPEYFGGHLSLVWRVVDGLRRSAAAAGLDTAKAEADILKGDAAYRDNDWKRAYDWYVSAYQRMIK